MPKRGSRSRPVEQLAVRSPAPAAVLLARPFAVVTAEDRAPGLIKEGHGLRVNAYALHGRTRGNWGVSTPALQA